MEQFFENFYPRAWLRPFHLEWPTWGEFGAPLEEKLPKVDVQDQADKVVITAEIPGVNKDDLEVSLSENTVTIRGRTEQKKEEKKGEYFRREISSGSFARTLPLPAEVDGTQAKASFKNGMLELTLPKTAQTKKHSIKIEG
jgi:HSP20 family protein